MQEILRRIATGSLPQVLFVHGQELSWHHKIYMALKERNSKDSLGEWNWSLFQGSKDFELEPFLLELGMIPWGDTAKIVVLKEAEKIPVASMEKIVNFMTKNPRANFLAIFMEKVDNRWKYLKTLRQIALEVECAPLQEDGLVRYLTDFCSEQGKTMKRATAEFFLEWVGTNFLVIQKELDKLLAYCEDDQEINIAHIKSICSLSPGQIANNTIFQMTDLIMQKKRQEALEILRLLLEAGEPALRILPLIERQLRLLLAAKTSTVSLEETAKQMGESNAYALRKVEPHAKTFRMDELMAGFAAILHADRELKLGTAGEQVLTDLIIKLT